MLATKKCQGEFQGVVLHDVKWAVDDAWFSVSIKPGYSGMHPNTTLPIFFIVKKLLAA